MSSTRQAGTPGNPNTDPSNKTQAPQLPPPRPFVPQRKTFVVLCVLFAVWVGFLVTLYFTTIYPKRYPAKPASPAPAGRVVTQ